MFKLLAFALIKGYQMLFRGILPPSCRYTVSCSEFMLWAINAFGLKQGLLLGIKRILSCHPFWRLPRPWDFRQRRDLAPSGRTQ